MKFKIIDDSNFDELYLRANKVKTGKKIVYSRFFINKLNLKNKVVFINKYLYSFSDVINFTFKIQYWESDEKIKIFFQKENDKLIFKKNYKQGQKPGVLYIISQKIDKIFFEKLLNNVSSI